MSKKKEKNICEKIDNFFEKIQYLFPVGMLLYAFLLILSFSFLSYLINPNIFFNNFIFYCYEILIVLTGLVYVLYTFEIIFNFVCFLLMSFINFIFLILRLFKFKKKYINFKKDNKIFLKVHYFMNNLLLFSLFIILIGIIYGYFLNFRILNNLLSKDNYYLVSYYIILLIISSFILIIYEFYLNKKKLQINIFSFKKWILFLFIFLVIFGFSLIQIDKLNNENLISASDLNCSYPTASYSYIVQNHSIDCKFSVFNESTNYSIFFYNKFHNYNFSYNLTPNNSSMRIKFPSKEESYFYMILENGKSLFQDDIYIISYEKYLDTLEKIEDRKLAYFIGSFIVFFALIQFLISLDNWLKKSN